MKALILERRGNDAAVLAENGTFIKVRHTGGVGEEIDIADITDKAAPVRIWRSGAAKFLTAAAIVLTLIGGSYHYMDVSVSAYVSIDAGGSSVELAVNRLGRVRSVRPASDDDAGLAEALGADISGMSVEDAVIAALDTIADSGETVSGEAPVIVGITSESEVQVQSLENAIANKAELPVRTVRVSENEREEAHKQDIGGGMYVYGTGVTTGAVVTEEQHEDIVTVTTTAGTTAVPVSGTEFPTDITTKLPTEHRIVETQENESTEKSVEITLSQDSENEIVQAPDITSPPQQTEQFSDETTSEKQDGQGLTASAPVEGEKPGNEQSPDNMPPELPAEQDGKAADAAVPDEGVKPLQDGHEDKPPERPGKQNDQEQGDSVPDEGDIPPQDVREQENTPPERSGEQYGQAQDASAPEEGVVPPQEGQQPGEQNGQEPEAPALPEGGQAQDNIPPGQPEYQNMPNDGAPDHGDGAPPEPPTASPDTMAPPDMTAPDSFGQR